MIALKEAYNAGLFKSEHLGKNISAGIVVGIVAMPLAMAFAIASGVSPAQGIYTAIISAFFRFYLRWLFVCRLQALQVHLSFYSVAFLMQYGSSRSTNRHYHGWYYFSFDVYRQTR